VRIKNDLQKLRLAMDQQNSTGWDSVAFGLYVSLLDSSLQLGNSEINRIIISAGGLTGQIPFDALIYKRTAKGVQDFRNLNYLLNRYDIRFTLGSGMLYHQTMKKTNIKGLFASFIPDYRNLAELRFSKKLVNTLMQKYSGFMLYGSDAGKKRLLSMKDSPLSVLHIAAHAEAGDIDNPVLFLGDDTLQLRELMGVRFPVDMVVIAGCETAKGREHYGDGTRSLSRAFTYSGSGSTISTLWQVDDKSTSEILEKFYSMLMTKYKSHALSDAKRQFISDAKSSEAANPFYWSGIILTGSDTPLHPALTIYGYLSAYFVHIVIGLSAIILITALISIYKNK
jgi:CHAT domain-containing protein